MFTKFLSRIGAVTLAFAAPLALAGCAAPDRAVAQDPAAVFAAMDSVYERFARAYRLGQPDSVVALYTGAPLYLPGQGPILEGRQELRSQFGFLESFRAQGATPHITFESAGRGTSGDLAWDVGYYTIRVETGDGSVTPPNRGKFTTVWQRSAEGEWRIHVDGFSPAPPVSGSTSPNG